MASTFEALLLAQVTALQNSLNALTANTPQLLGSTILGAPAASIPITIPAGYNHLQAIFTARQDSGSGGAFATLRLNADTGNNYTWQVLFGQQTTTTAANSAGAVSSIRIGIIPGSGDTANYFATGTIDIGNCSSAVFKPVSSHYQGPLTTSNGASGTAGGLWASTAVVTSVTLLPNSGNLVAGSSMSIYGWK